MQLYSLQENTPLLLFILTSVNSLLMSNVSQSLVWSLISGHSFHWVGFRVCLPWCLGKSPQYEDAIFLSKTPKKTFYWTLNNETLATNEWCHFDHIHLLLSFYDINIKYDYFCGMACNGKSFIFGLNSQGVCIYFFLPVVQQLCISLKLQSNYKNNTSCKKWKSHKEIWQRTGNQIRCIWDGNVQLLGVFFFRKFSLCLDPSGWQGAHLIIKAKKIMVSSCFILIHLSSLQCLRNQEWFQESSELVTDVV